MCRALIASCVLAASGSVLAQAAPAQRAQSFEVASIKKVASSDVPAGIRPIGPGGQFRAVLTVHDLVRVAYSAPLALLDSQVVGGPDWVRVDRFEITAKIGGAPADFSNGPPAQLLGMMRTLLEDRFMLRTRREVRRMQIYDLVLDKRATRGPQLRPADGMCVSTPLSPADSRPLCGFMRFAAGHLTARGMTLEVLAGGMSSRAEIERVVRDRTGLSGKFDIDLDYTPGIATPTDAVADSKPALFTAVREQLGLRLQPAIGPVEMIVIEAVERTTDD